MELDLERLTEQEAQAYELFRRKYIGIHPPPSARHLGWQFYALVLTSLAAVILAALRTADQFYKAAQLAGSEWLARAEAVSVLFAIEGGIVIYSAIRASTTKNIALDKMKLGIIIMVIISTFAGLGQSLNLIQGIDPKFQAFFQYALSFVIGIGASVVAWIGGEVLGGQIAAVGVRTEQDVDAYESSLLKAWNASPERKLARGELVDAVKGRSFDERTGSEQNRTRPYLPNEGQYEQRRKIIEFLVSVFNSEGRVPGPSEIARDVGVSKGYAHQIRSEWIRENSDVL